MIDYAFIGARLKEARIRKNMTQEQQQVLLDKDQLSQQQALAAAVLRRLVDLTNSALGGLLYAFGAPLVYSLTTALLACSTLCLMRLPDEHVPRTLQGSALGQLQ